MTYLTKIKIAAEILVALYIPAGPNHAYAQEGKDVRFYSLDKEYRQLETESYHLEKARALELKPVVQNMLSIYGTVYVNEKENKIYVTDTAEMVRNVMLAVKDLDVEGISAGGNLDSRLILLKKSNAVDIIELVRHKLSKEGQVIAMSDLNGLVVTDIKSKTDELEKLVQVLDVPAKHVMMEITILELNNEYYRNVGIDVLGALDGVLRQSNIHAAYDLYRSVYKINDQPATTNEQTNLSAHSNVQLNLGDLIRLLIQDGKGKVLASTRLVAKNNKNAYLRSIEMIRFSPESSYDNSARAGISVSVMPVIQEDEMVNLNISPSISSLSGWSPKGEPIIFDRSLQTNVNVRDGETFVLGGLTRSERAKSRKGVPILKSIPILRFFFSKSVDLDLTRQVIMFITPRIIKDTAYLPAEDQKILNKMKMNPK